jgi:hypothetical protein
MSSYHARALRFTEEMFTELENRFPSDSTVTSTNPLQFEGVAAGPIVVGTMTPEYFEAYNEILEIQKNLLRFINKHLS